MAGMEQEIIAQKLEQYVAQRTSDATGQGYFARTLDEMRAQSSNTFNRPVASRLPVVGGLVVAFKKLVRRLVAWYNNPFAGQQTAFNTAAVQTTEYLNRELLALQAENQALRCRLERLEDSLAAQKRQGTAPGSREADG